MNSIAIMQGRLSLPQGNRLQFFPTNWLAEFSLAKQLGFDYIEWFLDRDIPNFEPIKDIWLNTKQLEKIDTALKILPISSIDCGLYPMFKEESRLTLSLFFDLFPVLASRLSTKIVSIPLLEKNAPHSQREKEEVKQTISQLLSIAQPLNLKLALETEMPADELIYFIDSFKSPNVGVCYDIGNAVSYGVDAPSEIRRLGSKIFEVHCKDRKIGTTQSVLLGSGGADFPACFEALAESNYQGVFTLQAWRGEDYLNDAMSQLALVRSLLKQTDENK